MNDITASFSIVELSRLAQNLRITPQRMLAAGHCAPAILEALKYLREQCDGARTRDGMGFSRYWADWGHWLAEQHGLTALQAAVGQHIVLRHRRQIPRSLLAAAIGDLTAADLKKRRRLTGHRLPLTNEHRSEGLARNA